jgi:hypothetical protein
VALATTVEHFYQGAVPFDCDFSVNTIDRARHAFTTQQAHVVIARPGELVATLASGIVVVVHASRLAAYDPVAHQWFSTPVAPDFVPVALCYAGGPGSLTGQLTLEAYREGATYAQGVEVLVGTPNRSNAVPTIIVYARPSGEVTRTIVFTPLGTNGEHWDQVRCDGVSSAALPVVSNALPLSGASAKFLDEVASLTTAIP